MVCNIFTGSWGGNFVEWLTGSRGGGGKKDNSGKVDFIGKELSFFTMLYHSEY